MPLLLPKRKAAPKLARHQIKPTGSLRHLATRLFNTPLMVHPNKIPYYLAVLGPRLGLRHDLIPALATPDVEVVIDDDGDDDEPDDADPCDVIPIFGTLVKRSTGMDSLSGLTSYDYVRAEIAAALDDPKCESIVMDFDSPGGEAAGMFDLCSYIASVRGQKPIVGISNDEAYSAAYALASCCDKLLVTGIGGVGSIGVYMLHVDKSKQDEMNGLDYTYVFSGENKVDWNPHQPLSKVGLADAQAEVDRVRQMFVQTVSRNRNVDAQSIFDTEAKTYMGAEGIPMLADGVGTFEDAVELAGMMSKAARSLWMGSIEELEISAAQEGTDVHGMLNLKLTVDSKQALASLDRIKRSQLCGAVSPHKTATSDKAWDAAANEKRLPSPMPTGTAKAMYAWIDDSKIDKGEIAKANCSLPHHEVSTDGKPGAANVKGCQSAIRALNGARGGSSIPSGDRKGTWNHLAKHLRDAGLEPAPLKSETELSVRSIDRAALLTSFVTCGWAELTVAVGTVPEQDRILALRKCGGTRVDRVPMVQSSDSPTHSISGILAPYDSLSENLGGFRELYEPGCFSDGLQSDDDIWIFSHHNPEHVLGCRSAATARFWEERDGLHYQCILPDTQPARDLKVSMERRDIKESSAAFYITRHRWEQRDGERVRVVEKARLVEGSPCVFAAYKESTAEVEAVPTQEHLAAADAGHDLQVLEARLRLLKL